MKQKIIITALVFISVLFVRADTFRTREQVIEISRKSPEEGVYAVPPGYEKKEKFTLDEIGGIK